jgi:hypothetical protein
MYNLWQLPIKHFKIMTKYIQDMPQSGLKDQIRRDAIEMLEKPETLVYD